jgi:hypothetical protein
MSSEEMKVACPLCEGRGVLLRSEIADHFTNKELLARLDARITEILEDIAGVIPAPAARNFQREVHTWNPTLPIWRRSPKE